MTEPRKACNVKKIDANIEIDIDKEGAKKPGKKNQVYIAIGTAALIPIAILAFLYTTPIGFSPIGTAGFTAGGIVGFLFGILISALFIIYVSVRVVKGRRVSK